MLQAIGRFLMEAAMLISITPVGSAQRLWMRAAPLSMALLAMLSLSLLLLPGRPAEAADLETKQRALAQASAAVVGVRTTAVADARSADTLGRERQGSGVLIAPNGLVLTIGYLILEADHVDLLFDDQRTVPARVVAYDLASGFGLLQALAPVRVAPVPLGNSAELPGDEPLMIASGATDDGSNGGLSLAHLVSRRAFSGYWEYHIDGALFTAPARRDHSGAALFNSDGELLGIGSLVVADAQAPGEPRTPGNMFVPIDLLKPILTELIERGASRSSSRAWLGLNCVESERGVRVLRVSRDSPAEVAGLVPGDRILRIDGAAVSGLESFYKALWQGDGAEREVQLDIERRGETQTLRVMALDRMKTLSKPQGI
jgi:serine protease Do